MMKLVIRGYAYATVNPVEKKMSIPLDGSVLLSVEDRNSHIVVMLDGRAYLFEKGITTTIE